VSSFYISDLIDTIRALVSVGGVVTDSYVLGAFRQ